MNVSKTFLLIWESKRRRLTPHICNNSSNKRLCLQWCPKTEFYSTITTAPSRIRLPETISYPFLSWSKIDINICSASFSNAPARIDWIQKQKNGLYYNEFDEDNEIASNACVPRGLIANFNYPVPSAGKIPGKGDHLQHLLPLNGQSFRVTMGCGKRSRCVDKMPNYA